MPPSGSVPSKDVVIIAEAEIVTSRLSDSEARRQIVGAIFNVVEITEGRAVAAAQTRKAKFCLTDFFP